MSREVKVGNEWVRVAGRGKAEYGASHCQTGTQNLTQSVDAWKSSVITLSEAMPDSDYCVDLSVTGSNLLGIVQLPVVIAKTASTFTVGWINDTSKVGASDVLRIDYTAFKLYSDKEYDGLLDDVAEMKTYDGSTTGTLAMSTKTGQSISPNKCVLIAKNMWFVDFSLTCTDSFTGVDYTLGQMPLGTLTINGKSVSGVLSGKLYGSAYTDDSTAITVTMPATCHPSQGWIFFGRQQGLAGTSSSSKFKTLGTNINRFAGILYATA